jgi:hypothetical protein
MLILPELNALFSVSPRRPTPHRPRHDACISLFVTISLLFISPIPPLANAAGNAAARHRIRHTRQGKSGFELRLFAKGESSFSCAQYEITVFAQIGELQKRVEIGKCKIDVFFLRQYTIFSLFCAKPKAYAD